MLTERRSPACDDQNKRWKDALNGLCRKPLVSVIVPAYNVETFIADCLDSLLIQTFESYEVIIVDDGSTDATGLICDCYSEHTNIINAIHTDNRGPSAARNTGIALAEGRYLTFVDSDDFVSPLYLETLYEAMLKNGADIASCGFTTSEKEVEHVCHQDEMMQILVFSGRGACKDAYRFNGCVPAYTWSQLFDRMLFENERFPVGRYYEDQYLIPRLLFKSEKVVVVKKSLYYYRMREGSTTHSDFSIRYYQDLEAVEHCISYYRAEGDEETEKAARGYHEFLMAKMQIMAIVKRKQEVVPKQYRMTEKRAFSIIRKYASDSYYSYWLNQLHPKRYRAHEYWNKVISVLGQR